MKKIIKTLIRLVVIIVVISISFKIVNGNIAFGKRENLIIVDPGHGGHDPGTVGVSGIQEKDINLEIALKLASQLKSQGYDVIMTRDRDEYIDNHSRAKLANKKRGGLFISIHANAMENDNWTNGVQVLYYPDRDGINISLANKVLESILEKTGANNKGIVERKDLIVLNRTKMPAILVEAGFLTNPNEEELLKKPDYQDKIVEGIINFLKINH